MCEGATILALLWYTHPRMCQAGCTGLHPHLRVVLNHQSRNVATSSCDLRRQGAPPRLWRKGRSRPEAWLVVRSRSSSPPRPASVASEWIPPHGLWTLVESRLPNPSPRVKEGIRTPYSTLQKVMPLRPVDRSLWTALPTFHTTFHVKLNQSNNIETLSLVALDRPSQLAFFKEL